VPVREKYLYVFLLLRMLPAKINEFAIVVRHSPFARVPAATDFFALQRRGSDAKMTCPVFPALP
jgi:hypothetical protein